MIKPVVVTRPVLGWASMRASMTKKLDEARLAALVATKFKL